MTDWQRLPDLQTLHQIVVLMYKQAMHRFKRFFLKTISVYCTDLYEWSV